MVKIKYEQSWCEYLTDCPCGKKEYGSEYVKVGSWECNNCTYHINDDHKNKIVTCKGNNNENSSLE